jgi:hypothetical protein
MEQRLKSPHASSSVHLLILKQPPLPAASEIYLYLAKSSPQAIFAADSTLFTVASQSQAV